MKNKKKYQNYKRQKMFKLETVQMSKKCVKFLPTSFTVSPQHPFKTMNNDKILITNIILFARDNIL